ncbi:MAG: 4Fe-4S binding protein [Planctomycetes bacterium]|nr:4Fe-4S binding protein [Planctomycetota bacterium]
MKYLFLIFVLAFMLAPAAFGQQRFPPPDFETGYKQPILELQTQQTLLTEVSSTVLLFVALGVGSWLLLWKRSRRGIFALGLASVLYFGFYKGGCICPIGAIENITLALSDSSYMIPLMAVVVFVAPLAVALVVGRVFCGAACPLGLIQDIFLFRPVRVPRWLEEPLGLLRYLFLGLVVYSVVATGYFLMCGYDPFVPFFRFGGTLGMFAFGGAFLLLGMFVGRPFCRFLCPYGALLSLAARWTSVGVSVTPDECIDCSLCKDACPFGALLPPREEERLSPGRRRALWGASAMVFVVCAVGGYLAAGRSSAGAILGAWFGGVIAAKLVSVCVVSERETYEVDHAKCFACARCYMSCPRERDRLKKEGETVASE